MPISKTSKTNRIRREVLYSERKIEEVRERFLEELQKFEGKLRALRKFCEHSDTQIVRADEGKHAPLRVCRICGGEL